MSLQNDKIVWQTQLSIISAYRNKIRLNKLTLEEVVDILDADFEYLQQESGLLEVQTLLSSTQTAPTIIHSSDKVKRLVEYCYDFAWHYGRYFHVGDADKIIAAVSEKLRLPEEAISSLLNKEQ